MQNQVSHITEVHRAVKERVGKAVVGKEDVIDLLVITLLCGGHMLIDDVPGTGKTLLAKSFAEALSLSHKRIQCVPDMLPSDITGVNFFDMKESLFRFVEGPVFTNILLADEINRAMPKTQAGLLECMEEKQVTVDGTTYRLDSPFLVIATQNPVETKGTFELPEAQLDRFLVKTSMGYPTREEGVEILKRKFVSADEASTLPPISKETVLLAIEELKLVYVHEDLFGYIAAIVEATRASSDVILGAGPRAMVHLLYVSMGYAAIAGRDYLLPDDVKKASVPVLAHRIVFKNRFYASKNQGEEMIEAILKTVPVPTEDFSAVK